MSENAKFEAWAIVDLFGHQRLAGKVSEQAVGGCAFVRVDVPATAKSQAFTRLLGNGAIYSISLVTEETARAFVEHASPQVMEAWDMRTLLRSLPAPTRQEIVDDIACQPTPEDLRALSDPEGAEEGGDT